MAAMCHDCPTRKDRVRGVVHELVTDLVLPLILYAVPVGALLLSGHLEL